MQVNSTLTNPQSEEQPRFPTPYPEVTVSANPADPILPISPKSVPAILATFKDNVNSEILIKIIKSLLRTIEV